MAPKRPSRQPYTRTWVGNHRTGLWYQLAKAKIAVDEVVSAVIRADAIKNLEFILHKFDQLDKYNMLIVKGYADRLLSKDDRIWNDILINDERIRRRYG